MSNTAVIQIQGKQYLVSEGQELSVDLLPDQKKAEIEEVLMIADGDTVKLGKPFIKSARVKYELVENGKAPKIRVATYKAKSRSRRVVGHRQHISTIKINKISA